MQSVKIINFQSQYAHHFYELNVEWLKAYFYVEPYDEKVLSNPQKYIIETGGYIFFALQGKKIVGTVALIHQESFYELSKMAVAPSYRGFKIGQQLMDHCIRFAKEQQWKSITLYSHRSLVSAIKLYSKVGFEEITLEADSHYERSDIKMRLDL